MDTEAVLGIFDKFLGLLILRANTYDHDKRTALDRQIEEKLLQVKFLTEGIIDNPNWHQPALGTGAVRWIFVEQTVTNAKGWLETREETQRIKGPTGPRLSATSFHPTVWNAALALWTSGHHWEAVRNAAEQLNPLLQAKVGRIDLSGTDLVGQAFSIAEPTPDAPRLRFPGYVEGTQEWRSAHLGALHFGQGCMFAIRNVTTHTTKDGDEQEALEQLAALSVFARMIDASERETAT